MTRFAVASRPAGLSPIVVSKIDANLTLIGNSTWKDFETAGSAASRPMDVVIPNVKATDWVSINADAFYGNEASNVFVTMATIVGGAVVNRFRAANTLGVQSWTGLASAFSKMAGQAHYQLVAGDIENGAVRLRQQYFITTGQPNHTVFASAGFAWTLEGRGPFV